MNQIKGIRADDIQINNGQIGGPFSALLQLRKETFPSGCGDGIGNPRSQLEIVRYDGDFFQSCSRPAFSAGCS